MYICSHKDRNDFRQMQRENITSAQNRKIKELQTLYAKAAERKARGLFVVEGARELAHCLESGIFPKTIFLAEELYSSSEFALKDLLDRAESLNPHLQIIDIPAFLYEKVAYRGTTEGIVAEMETVSHDLGSLSLGDNPLVIVLESVEKPGNLGAVLRSADAAAADAVIVCDPLTDLYNPNLIRSSIGAVFTVPVAVCDSGEAIRFLKDRNIRICTAQLQDAGWYYETDMKQGTAIVMGTESTGLSQIWRNAADTHIKIPMLGRLDSLNVSVSAAILLFEAVRQRRGRSLRDKPESD